MPITTLSYLAAAFGFLLLALLAATRWRDRPGILWIGAASLFSLVWALYLALLSWQIGGDAAISAGVFEVGRNASWFAVLLSLLAPGSRGAGGYSRALRLWIALTIGFIVVLLLPFIIPGLPGAEQWHGMSLLLMTIVGLVLVEQTFRNTPPQRRWEIKFLVLGLGAMFAFDLFLFADLVLFQTLDSPTWQARGFVTALVVPLLAISVSRRLPQQQVPVVSRHLLFHTASLTGAGVYLLAVGGTGYYLREFGGELGALLQVTFLFGAALILALVLFSGAFRARLRIFLSKHFFKYKYDYRKEWLRFTATLSSDDEAMPFAQRAIHAIAELVESSGGLLWVRREDDTYALDGVLNLGEPDYPPEPADSPLIQFLTQTGWVIDLEEYAREPAIYQGLVLPDWLLHNPRHWAVVPLLKADGLEGFAVLAQPRAPHQIDWEERDLLKTAGRQLAVYVALVHTGEALLEARQFETFHRLTAFLVHDLKNVSAQLSLICANAGRHRDNPEFIADAFETVANARDRLERTMGQLRNVQPRAEAASQVIALPTLLQEVVAGSQGARPVPQLELRDSTEVTGDPESLKNVLLHLVRNAQEATPDHGRVQLTLYTEGAWAIILVEDNGSGIDEDFLRRRLFRPFQTTKGNAGMGIGLYEAREQIVRMGGRIEVHSEVGTGTLFTLRLPRYRRTPAAPGVSS